VTTRSDLALVECKKKREVLKLAVPQIFYQVFRVQHFDNWLQEHRRYVPLLAVRG
jgi:hypothetical protein